MTFSTSQYLNLITLLTINKQQISSLSRENLS